MSSAEGSESAGVSSASDETGMGDGCTIDGMSVAAGAAMDGEPCRICDPAMSTSDWSDAADGTACGDGGSCDGGSCVCPEPPPACPGGCVIETIDTTYTHYDPDGDEALPATTYDIRLTLPTEPGDYPIGIILNGTSGTDGSLGLGAVANALAEAGVVAAQVGYNNATASGCGCDGDGPGGGDCHPAKTYFNKAEGVFNIDEPTSAVSRIVEATADNDATADPDLGIVVVGWSQGTVVGHQASNWLDTQVRAAYFLGTGNRPNGGPACGRQDWYCNEADHAGVIPGDRVRLFTGEQDTYFSHAQDDAAACNDLSVEDTRIQSEEVSGCLSTEDVCELDGGAGWRVIRDADVADGTADHSFFNGDPTWQGESGLAVLPWSLSENVAWMLRRLAEDRCL